jgi:nucleoside-diphosphate-sugar epimerase
MDTYGTSKKVNEVTARSLQRRFGADVYALRIGNVVEPHEYATLFPPLAGDPGLRRRITFSYIDARDLGQIVDLCLGKDGLGFQVFNAVNDENAVPQPNSELLPRFFPKVPLSRPVEEREGLLSNRKIREVLGFKEQHPWQKSVS